MNRVLCLYPSDDSTLFLNKVYECICNCPNVIGLNNDTLEDDDFFDKLKAELESIDEVIFLGHGSSDTLYGTNLNPLIDKQSGLVNYLKGKSNILFSCNSSRFINNFNIEDSIGFGFIPTSIDDVRGGKLKYIDIAKMTVLNVEYFKNAIVNIWLNTIKESGISDLVRFYNSFRYYTNCEIVNCLMSNNRQSDKRIISDVLYTLKQEMILSNF